MLQDGSIYRSDSDEADDSSFADALPTKSGKRRKKQKKSAAVRGNGRRFSDEIGKMEISSESGMIWIGNSPDFF